MQLDLGQMVFHTEYILYFITYLIEFMGIDKVSIIDR